MVGGLEHSAGVGAPPHPLGAGKICPLPALPTACSFPATCGHVHSAGHCKNSPLSAEPATAANVSDPAGCPQPCTFSGAPC